MLIQRHKIKPCMTEQIIVEETKEVPAIDYESMTKSEIISVLELAEIEHDARQKKESLIELLKVGK